MSLLRKLKRTGHCLRSAGPRVATAARQAPLHILTLARFPKPARVIGTHALSTSPEMPSIVCETIRLGGAL